MKNNSLMLEIASGVSSYARKKAEIVKDCASFAWDTHIGWRIEDTADFFLERHFVATMATLGVLSLAVVGYTVKATKEINSFAGEQPALSVPYSPPNVSKLPDSNHKHSEPKRRMSKKEKRELDKKLKELERDLDVMSSPSHPKQPVVTVKFPPMRTI